MTDSRLPINPAFQLHDLIGPWALTPKGQSAIGHREKMSGLEYSEAFTNAMRLMAEISQYLDERAQANPGRGTARGHFLRIRDGILGLKHSLSDVTGSAIRCIEQADLEWLDTLGSNWNRQILVPPSENLREIDTLTSLVEEHVCKIDGLSADHRAYLLELCGAMHEAVRDVRLYGGAHTARLAMELIGALNTFVDNDETKAFTLRLKKVVRSFIIYYAAPTVAQLTASGLILSIAAPL